MDEGVDLETYENRTVEGWSFVQGSTMQGNITNAGNQ